MSKLDVERFFVEGQKEQVKLQNRFLKYLGVTWVQLSCLPFLLVF